MGEELVGQDLFDEDYLWFYDERLEQGSDAQVELIERLLDLPSGAAVLDAPCGHGRIANRMAGRGWRVARLDSSCLFLDLARERAEAAGVSVEYVEGDLRKLPFENRFDAAVNWFSSFGYFDDAGNQRVLDGFRRALRIIVRDGRVRRTGFTLVQATASELARMLRDAGFGDVRALDEKGDPFTSRSRRLLMLAR